MLIYSVPSWRLPTKNQWLCVASESKWGNGPKKLEQKGRCGMRDSYFPRTAETVNVLTRSETATAMIIPPGCNIYHFFAKNTTEKNTARTVKVTACFCWAAQMTTEHYTTDIGLMCVNRGKRVYQCVAQQLVNLRSWSKEGFFRLGLCNHHHARYSPLHQRRQVWPRSHASGTNSGTD